jgi:SMI1-KNR4 cell-wall
MEIKEISLIITQLIEFWQNQKIIILSKTKQEIDNIEKNSPVILPSDFRKLYERVNGMGNFYPNEIDEEGFLFYPIEGIISVNDEFKNSSLENNKTIFLFAEYMHKSWWYGFDVSSNGDYVIGIIPEKNKFKPITNSLAEFIELYMEDSPLLYDYS